MLNRCLRRVSRAAMAIVGAAVAIAAGACDGATRAAPAQVNDASIGRPVADPAGTMPAPNADDPLACKGCHQEHYRGWSVSMHAYAAEDPIFIAMNTRAQRETGGALGDFCVRCHAPLAVARGATTDGLNLSQLPSWLHGVTCVVCHTAPSGVANVARASLDIADDSVMRGPIADPISTPVHASMYSPAHDRQQSQSATLCGACHAVTNRHGLEVERTIDEWRATTYAKLPTLRTCGRCHMPETIGAAARVVGAPLRPVHDHAMPGVDLGAASPEQRKLVQEELDPAISSKLCVIPGAEGTQVRVTIENALVGHAWPSGATHDRRAWVELVAYAGGAITYTSGAVGDGEAVTATASPPLILLREQLYDVGSPGTELEFAL